MLAFLTKLLSVVRSGLRSQARLQAEVLFLHQQVLMLNLESGWYCTTAEHRSGDLGVALSTFSLAVPPQNSKPNVLMVEATENWNRGDAADGLWASDDGRIFVQRQVRANLIIVASAALQDLAQVASPNTI